MFGRVIALLCVAGCATTSAADVHKMGDRGDVGAILEAWEKTESEAVRIAVMEELARHPEDAGGRSLVLRQAGSASSEPLKLAATRALAAHSGGDATAVLISGLGDPWPAIREVAQATLAARAAEAHAELSVALATNTSHLVRAGCARLLTNVAVSNSELRAVIEEALLERAIRDDAPKVREQAASALGTLHVVRARTQLIELMRADPDAGVRMSAERALQKLGEAAIGNVVVAVLPLQNNTGLRDADLERLGAEIAEYVAARLSAGKVCHVIDPEKLETAISELKKVGAAMYDGDSPSAPAIGRFKIANQLVYGSLQRQGSTFTIVLNRMDVATLAQIPGAAVTVQGFRPDLQQLKVRAADQMVSTFR